jgi:hypothetical protein
MRRRTTMRMINVVVLVAPRFLIVDEYATVAVRPTMSCRR